MSGREPSSPRDLAHIVSSRVSQVPGMPSLESLMDLLQVLFHASLKSEEHRPIRCVLGFASPSNPDPQPPKNIRPNRWVYTAFKTPLPLTPQSLAKLALATDPSVSGLAVYGSRSRPMRIHGVFDQQGEYHRFIEGEPYFLLQATRSGTPTRPKHAQATDRIWHFRWPTVTTLLAGGTPPPDAAAV